MNKYLVAFFGIAGLGLSAFVSQPNGGSQTPLRSEVDVVALPDWTCAGTFSDPWDYDPYPGNLTNQQVQALLSSGWSYDTTSVNLNVAAKYKQSTGGTIVRCGILPAGTITINGPSGELYAKKPASSGGTTVALEVLVL